MRATEDCDRVGKLRQPSIEIDRQSISGEARAVTSDRVQNLYTNATSRAIETTVLVKPNSSCEYCHLHTLASVYKCQPLSQQHKILQTAYCTECTRLKLNYSQLQFNCISAISSSHTSTIAISSTNVFQCFIRGPAVPRGPQGHGVPGPRLLQCTYTASNIIRIRQC